MTVNKLLYLIFSCLFITTTFGAHFQITSHVHFDISINSQNIGRITVGLFGKATPKTVKNFHTICTKGIKSKTYTGTIFHRILNKSFIQGGDILFNNGSGITSIYGKSFKDENLCINHTGPGFIAMATNGPDTNGCQFYISTIATPWLDGTSTIFGKVVKGAAYVHIIEKEKTDSNFAPMQRIEIQKCSFERVMFPYFINDNPYDWWSWIQASAVPLAMSFSVLACFQILLKQLNIYEHKLIQIENLIKME